MKTKKYSITVTETDSNLSMKRVNDGFTAIELLGFLEVTKQEILDVVKTGMVDHIDVIERKVIEPE